MPRTGSHRPNDPGSACRQRHPGGLPGRGRVVRPLASRFTESVEWLFGDDKSRPVFTEGEHSQKPGLYPVALVARSSYCADTTQVWVRVRNAAAPNSGLLRHRVPGRHGHLPGTARLPGYGVDGAKWRYTWQQRRQRHLAVGRRTGGYALLVGHRLCGQPMPQVRWRTAFR